jgi:hypothetical protein
MYALNSISLTNVFCGNFATAAALGDELVALGDEKGVPFWKAFGMLDQGCVLALTGEASNAVHMIISGITAYRSTGATLWMPLHMSYLAWAYAELGQTDDAWRYIDEAMTAVETTGERWCEAEVNRAAGEIALLSPEPEKAKARVFRPGARSCAQAAGKVMGTPRRNEPRAAPARSGQAG